MKILAVETSTIVGSVAILDDNKLIADGRLGIKAIHSERLMNHIDFLLVSTNLCVSDIDYFAVSVGPGSFTGLRVGISTIKGLAFAAEKLVAPVSSLEALAMNALFSNHCICPILDARKGEVYTALYQYSDGKLNTIIPETILSPEDLTRLIKYKTIFLGDGLNLYGKLIKERLGDIAEFCHGSHMFPSATNVAFLSHIKIHKGELLTAQSLSARYIRRSEAEIKFG